MYKSFVETRGEVSFPEFANERVYMEPFWQDRGLPLHLARWQKTVDQMLVGIQTSEPIYLMVDQSVVERGEPHRRPGVHIDGYWWSGERMHGAVFPGGRHGAPPPPRFPVHRASAPAAPIVIEDWHKADFVEPEAILLASDIEASRAFRGDYSGLIGPGGDCSRIGLDDLEIVSLTPNRVHAGNVSFLHESLPVAQRCARTLVRLNVPGWSPE